MLSITMQGEGFGGLAAEGIIRKATAGSEFKRRVAAFQIFLEATVAFNRREQGEEAALAFHQAALDERKALDPNNDAPVSCRPSLSQAQNSARSLAGHPQARALGGRGE